jgi:hypothetical protein
LDNIQESRSENKGNDNDEIDYCAFLFSKVYNEGRPIESPNLLLKKNDDTEIIQCILLPLGEGDNRVVVAVQRVLGWRMNPIHVLAIYDADTDTWIYAFYFYPL